MKGSVLRLLAQFPEEIIPLTIGMFMSLMIISISLSLFSLSAASTPSSDRIACAPFFQHRADHLAGQVNRHPRLIFAFLLLHPVTLAEQGAQGVDQVILIEITLDDIGIGTGFNAAPFVFFFSREVTMMIGLLRYFSS